MSKNKINLAEDNPAEWDVYEAVLEYLCMTIHETKSGKPVLLNRPSPKSLDDLVQINWLRTRPSRATRVVAQGGSVEPAYTRDEFDAAVMRLWECATVKMDSIDSNGVARFMMAGMTAEEAGYDEYCLHCGRRIEKPSEASKMRVQGVTVWVHKGCKEEYMREQESIL